MFFDQAGPFLFYDTREGLFACALKLHYQLVTALVDSQLIAYLSSKYGSVLKVLFAHSFVFVKHRLLGSGIPQVNLNEPNVNERDGEIHVCTPGSVKSV